MKKLTILISAIIILSTYTMAAQGGGRGYHGMRGGHGQMNMRGGHGQMNMQGTMIPGIQFYTRWAEDLKLDDKQLTKIKDINTKFQTELIDLRADMQKKRLLVRTAFDKAEPNQSEIEAATKALHASRDKIHSLNLKMKFEMRNVLSTDQKVLIKTVQNKCRTEFRNYHGQGNGHGQGMKNGHGYGNRQGSMNGRGQGMMNGRGQGMMNGRGQGYGYLGN